MANQLKYEKSPYLLQHAENPVNWLPWGEEAFRQAAREEKPIFLSIGYSTCHWCHVMAHESFESEEVAQALNRDFISIKVDREERPDVDGVYMAACVAMNGSGGWPLTVLLTPEQKPFWAGTYLPKGQLLSLLEAACRLWRENRGQLREAGEALTQALNQTGEAKAGKPERELVEAGVEWFSQHFDQQWGGFGSPPKFPSAHNLLFLLRYVELTGSQRARGMAERTLEQMYRGGLFDHIGGGFSRYSTDRQWLVPHFEKMLYDNALLALAYAESVQCLNQPYCRKALVCTVDYVLRELTDPQGGFYCAQDADSGGVEGKYYLFSPSELLPILGREGAEVFCRWFHVTAPGYFEGGCIPNLIETPGWEGEPPELEKLRQKVYQYRRDRTSLHRDDKVLTSWNGLMIAALARAGLVLERPEYWAVAERAAEFIQQNLTDQQGRLLGRWREGQAAYPGKLEDYAFYAWGLLELYGVTFQSRLLAWACRLADHLLEFFFDGAAGGFYPYPKDGEQLITRTKETYDGAMPSGNGAAALVLSRLSRLTGQERWRRAAQLQFSYLAGAAQDNPGGHGFALLAMTEELWPSVELVCTARVVPEALISFLREEPGIGGAVLVKTEGNDRELAALAPFTKGYPIPKAGERYYLCRGGTCFPPVDSIEQLRAIFVQSPGPEKG